MINLRIYPLMIIDFDTQVIPKSSAKIPISSMLFSLLWSMEREARVNLALKDWMWRVFSVFLENLATLHAGACTGVSKQMLR